MLIRDEVPDDAAPIRALVTAAFQGHPHSRGGEAAIIDRLRMAGALALSLVQAWAKEHHEPVLHVPYTGRTASPAQQALSLARDASACARLAKERTDLIPRDGADLWQQAAERHAYAGVALEEQSLMELDLELATELGCNALRFATVVHGLQQEMMPRFPAGALIAGPQSVKACLRWLRQ